MKTARLGYATTRHIGRLGVNDNINSLAEWCCDEADCYTVIATHGRHHAVYVGDGKWVAIRGETFGDTVTNFLESGEKRIAHLQCLPHGAFAINLFVFGACRCGRRHDVKPIQALMPSRLQEADGRWVPVSRRSVSSRTVAI